MNANARLVVEQAKDNPYYMTYRIVADSGKQVSATKRVHKAESASNAIRTIAAQAEEKGYLVSLMPEGYTYGD